MISCFTLKKLAFSNGSACTAYCEESQRRLDDATNAAAMTFNLAPDGVLLLLTSSAGPATAPPATAPAATTSAATFFFEDGAAVHLTDTPADPVGVASVGLYKYKLIAVAP